MMNTATTPPVYRTLFPVKGNEGVINSLIKDGLELIIEHGYACYEGELAANNLVKRLVTGGVIA